MTQAFVQKSAKFTASAATNVTSGGITTTSGNHLVTTWSSWCNAVSTQGTVADNKSNSHAVDVSVKDGGSAGGFGRTSIASALNVTGGSGHTITVTQGGSPAGGTYFEGNVSEFSGTLTAAALDQTTTATSGASSTSVTPTTSATTQADEVVIACVVVNNSSATCGIVDPPTGYTSIGVNQDSNNTIGYEAAYKIVSAPGAQSAAYTFNSVSAGSGGAIATYKAAAGGATGIDPQLRSLAALAAVSRASHF